jgi:purine-binding chemotaxis protein CheW
MMSATSNPNPSAATASDSASMQFLTFRLGEGEYGFDVQHVQTLRHYDTLGRVGVGPQLIKNVVSMDGAILPLVDMRVPFHPEAPPACTRLSVVMIVALGESRVAVVTDGTHDLLTLDAGQIAPLQGSCGWTDDCLIGLATVAERRVVLLDAGHLFGRRGEAARRLVA